MEYQSPSETRGEGGGEIGLTFPENIKKRVTSLPQGPCVETSKWSPKISIPFSFYKKKKLKVLFFYLFIDREVFTIPNAPVKNVVGPLPST